MYCRFEGWGKFTFPNKNYYEGEFKDGQFQGRGTMVFPDTGRYEGNWDHGLCVKVATPCLLRWPYARIPMPVSMLLQSLVAVIAGLCVVCGASLRSGGQGIYIFADGLKYDEDVWGYNTENDRRYFSEINHDVKAAGA